MADAAPSTSAGIVPVDDERSRRHLESLQAATREELDRADLKAQIILAVSGIGISALLGGLFAQSWSPRDLSNEIEWIFWAGAFVEVAAVALLSYTVLPQTKRVGHNPDAVVAYFEDVIQYRDREELCDALAKSSTPDTDRLIDQIYSLSVIVKRQYVGIRRGMLTTAVAVTLFLLVALLSLFF